MASSFHCLDQVQPLLRQCNQVAQCLCIARTHRRRPRPHVVWPRVVDQLLQDPMDTPRLLTEPLPRLPAVSPASTHPRLPGTVCWSRLGGPARSVPHGGEITVLLWRMPV